MPRQLRIEYPGAIYHVMNRGDRREAIFYDEADRRRFIETLGEACTKTDWQVHAYCLMGNHFHLVVETPNPNLVAGMRWLLSTYTARFNRRHKLFGHLFSGRYKSLIVEGSGNGYLKTVCDYVHLNPARARLLSPEQPLRDFPWSSWPQYLIPPEQRPRWLRVDRLLGEFAIPRDSAAGREQLEKYLEDRRSGEEEDGVKKIRRGWCLGNEAFRKELLERARGLVTENHLPEIPRETAQEKARRILCEELDKMGWCPEQIGLYPERHADKVRLARRLRAETNVTLRWIADELKMGSWKSLASRLNQKKENHDASNQNELNLA